MLTGSAPNGRADIKHKAQIKKTRRPGEGTGGSRDLGLTRSIEGMEIASHVRRTVFVADSARQDEAIIFEGCFGGVSGEDFFVSVCIDSLDFSIFRLTFIQLHVTRASRAGFRRRNPRLRSVSMPGTKRRRPCHPPAHRSG